MRTMIEKVAKAILHEIREGGAFVNTNDDDLRYLVLVDGDVDMLAVARAAIEAMRDPTEAMLAETHELVIGFGGDDGTYNIHCEDWQAKDVWMTMIDAALKEGK